MWLLWIVLLKYIIHTNDDGNNIIIYAIPMIVHVQV